MKSVHFVESSQSTNDIINECAALLMELQITLGFAESATCGHIAYSFSLTRDAGKFLKGGIACYDAYIKEQLLNVDKQLIEQYTPESAEVTKAIAESISPLLHADICIGCTGLPSGGGSETNEKPVGTMFLHGSYKNETIFSDRTVFSGNQQQIIEKVTRRTAQLLLAYLKQKKNIAPTSTNENDNDNASDRWSVSWP
jgi:nicotinamide-nucleotide amidase